MWTARASSLSGWRRRPFWSSTASSLSLSDSYAPTETDVGGKPKTLVVARAPADSGTKTAYRPRNQDDSRAWSHVLHKGGPTRLLRRGRHDARAPKIMSDGRRASRGQPRTPAEVLQRVWWAGDGKGGDRDRPQAVSQVRAPRHAPWTQRAAPKLGTDVPQHPQ